MPKIIFIHHNGDSQAIDAKTGSSIMENAVQNMVAGIDADCGGACACATCHVYVDEAWIGKLEPRDDMEASMLEFAENVETNSRLSCQIKVTDDLDGIIVTVPESQ